MAIAGTLRGVTLDGVEYRAYADTNFQVGGNTEKEAMATSGEPIIKVTRRVNVAESVTLACSMAEYEQIKNLDDNQEPFPMSVTYADGGVIAAKGMMNIDSWESESGKLTLKLIPTDTDGWETFA